MILLGITLAAAAGAGVLWMNYRHDMNAAYARISGRSTVVPSPYGDLEYLEGGAGPAVLVVHASGGGFDQGELIAQTALGSRFRWIAPSRFGYLRSNAPAGATFDDQARTYAWLLDRLGIRKVAVVAYSHGGPSALLFALLYPDRVSSLTLVSCGVRHIASPAGRQADKKGKALVWLYKKDYRYWLATKLFKKQFLRLMGASGDVGRGLSDDQMKTLGHVVDYMNPASLRSAGTVVDTYAAMPDERIAGITAPTLIIHAENDTLQLYQNAAYAAATIPNARLSSFPTGGHLLMVIRKDAIRAAVQEHILRSIRQ
jgi:pimeloyl-ACP methyl ester carboxylesterase